MSKNILIGGLLSALGAVKGQIQDSLLGVGLGAISDLLLYISKDLNDDTMFHVISASIMLKRYESSLRNYVAGTASEYDDKVLDELFEAVDAILESQD